MPGYPNRCQHLKINGTQCGSPALRRNRYCFFHKRFRDEQIKLSAGRARRGVATFVLPLLEDANSIQIALMQVMRLLVSQQIEPKTASLLLYALQTASSNLRLTRFEPHRHDVILDPRDADQTPLDSRIWVDEDFEEEEDEEEEEPEVDPAAAAAAARARATQEKARKLKEANDQMTEWVNQHPQYRLVSENGRLRPEPILPRPDQKKPSAPTNPEKIRAEIADMVRKSGLVEKYAEKYPPSLQPGKPAEKKAT